MKVQSHLIILVSFICLTIKMHLIFVFKVVSAGRSGQQLDISTKIRAPSGKLVVYSNRKVEDQLLGYQVSEQAQCFYIDLNLKRWNHFDFAFQFSRFHCNPKQNYFLKSHEDLL